MSTRKVISVVGKRKWDKEIKEKNIGENVFLDMNVVS